MDCIINEIERYLNRSRLADTTKRDYKDHLVRFASYLSLETNSLLNEIHLNSIYKVYSKSGMFLLHRPIDATLIEKYFLDHNNNGYHWLRKSRSALCSFFDFLERRYEFNNPIKEININFKLYKKISNPQRILGRQEVLLFLHSLQSYSNNLLRDKMLFSLLLLTGCRISEILNLKVNDINAESDILVITSTKTRVQRTVALRENFGSLLLRFATKMNLSENDYLFYSKGKVRLSRYYVKKYFDEYLKRYGIKPINIHGLRHTFATMMYESGSELMVIQQFLGHGCLSSTETYVHPHYVRNYGMVIKENQEVYKIAKQILD
ncbi:site-specific integrase [Brevibacillus choshinensis]|uniref:tyrosine-type recombinase/integrase n=1 Tax=Brevibacillus choshinensis TaxID=54911 RepID=UPI002E1F3203|nr:site-specific integrase [Brevibacillus choshinensis]